MADCDRSILIARAYTKLREGFPAHHLNFLVETELPRRGRCPKINCGCSDETLIVDTISKVLQEKLEYVPRIMEPPSIEEPWTEVPVPAKKPEQTYRADFNFEQAFQFLDFVCREFIHARHDMENRLEHNLITCDCVRWLINTFDTMRSPGLFRFYKAFNVHNTYMIAIFTFCVKEGIIDRRELEPMRFAVGAVSENWWSFVKLPVGKGYQRDRKRKRLPFQNFQPNQCIPALNKYHQFLDRLRAQFPPLFDRTGQFDKDVLARADPGPTSKCPGCNNVFSSRYMIPCENLDETEQPGIIEESHLHCRPCFKAYFAVLKTEKMIAKTVKDYQEVFYFKCIEDKCRRAYSPKTIRTYISGGYRRRCFESLLDRCLRAVFENFHLEDALPTEELADTTAIEELADALPVDEVIIS